MAQESAFPKYLAEFVGTYMLVFTVGCNILTAQATWGVTSIACTLMVSIYALGPVSGANFNPAVSLALGLANKLNWNDVAIYIFCQLLGGITAGLTYAILFLNVVQLSPSPGFGFVQTMAAELLYTFMLCFVVLNVAASKAHAGSNQFYGLAIAFVVVAGGYGAGHISGGCFNPAVAVGIDFLTNLGLGWALIYSLAEFAGAALAALLFGLCRPEEKEDLPAGPPYEYKIGPRLLSEFIGTYMLVVTVGLNVLGGSRAPVYSIAAALMSMIFALGSVSGAHFNPAVTIGIMASGRNILSWEDAMQYIAAQLVGGITGAATYATMCAKGDDWQATFPLQPGTRFTAASACFAEVAFTFLLVFVVLSVATVRSPLTQYFGLAIGSCVTAGGYAIGAVSGGSLNPAVSVGISVSDTEHTGNVDNVWYCFMYVMCELIGGLLAAAVFRGTHVSEYKAAEKDVS